MEHDFNQNAIFNQNYRSELNKHTVYSQHIHRNQRYSKKIANFHFAIHFYFAHLQNTLYTPNLHTHTNYKTTIKITSNRAKC